VSEGNQEAFRQLFDNYRNKIFSISWKITGSQSAAEDVVQEIFIKIWLKKESLLKVENFDAYLNRMVRNHIFNCLRKIANEKSLIQKLEEKPIQQNNDCLEKVAYHELESIVQNAVKLLPPQQKRVYYFSRIEGLKYDEIAEKMGISASTVKGHITGALNHIKSVILSKNDSVLLLILINLYSVLLLIP
jgi:RNA polymerase sigma-70 factor (ECF subfamily)